MKENPSSPENTALFDRRTFLKGLFVALVLAKEGKAEAADLLPADIENALKADEPLMAPLFQKKYELTPETWKTVMEQTRKELLVSDDAKEDYKTGGKAALQRYVWFRTELNAIGAGKFNATETGQNPFYQKIIQRLSKKGIKPDEVQKLFSNERLQKTNLRPLYFYCRPHSAKKQYKENTLKTEDFFGLDIKVFSVAYAKELEEAEKQFGVNKEILIAILKIESKLGLRTLDFSAFEVLNAIVSRYFVDPIAPKNSKEELEKRGGWEKLYDLNHLTPEEIQKVQKALLSYNKSSAYGNTILSLAQKIQAENQN